MASDELVSPDGPIGRQGKYRKYGLFDVSLANRPPEPSRIVTWKHSWRATHSLIARSHLINNLGSWRTVADPWDRRDEVQPTFIQNDPGRRLASSVYEDSVTRSAFSISNPPSSLHHL